MTNTAHRALPASELLQGSTIIKSYGRFRITQVVVGPVRTSIQRVNVQDLQDTDEYSVPNSKLFTVAIPQTWWRTPQDASLRGLSAGDVARYEAEEMGNGYGEWLAPPDFALLDTLPATHVVWACKTKTAARRYRGKPESFSLTDPVVLAQDGDGGYFLLLTHPDEARAIPR